MNLESLAKFVEAISKLISALVWPVVFLYVLVRFGPALRNLIADLGEFSLKGAGFEASGKRRQTEATAALTAAAVANPESAATPEGVAKDAREAAELVSKLVTPKTIRKAERAQVLWVDDRPENNVFERRSMRAVGISFTPATSTAEALGILQQHSFAAIISDMSRPPDEQAGYTLLDRLRASGDRTPYVIYASSRSPENRAEALRRGAIGYTNRPNELFKMVIRAVRRG